MLDLFLYWIKGKGSLSRKDNSSQVGKTMSYSGPNLPEDIWQHIHTLMSLRDAARAACVSRAFLHSWRHRPNLTLTMQTLGYADFTRKVDNIFRNHSGLGVKILNLELIKYLDGYTRNCLDSWLQIAVTPRIEELTLMLFSHRPLDALLPRNLEYEFPCLLLSDGSGSSIQSLELECCALQPTVQLGCLGNLTKLHLSSVRITGDGLGCLLSISVVLEHLELKQCHEIISLKIPCMLHRLSYLHVYGCARLQEIENKAENIHSMYLGDCPAALSLRESLQFGELLQLKSINLSYYYKSVYYARAEVPSIAPNLETLTLHSLIEMVNTPVDPSKFLHLKHLSIQLGGVSLSPAYDYLSLASFIDASPSLETFSLKVPQRVPDHDLTIFGASSDLRQTQSPHHNLRSFKIIGFCTAKSLVELTCHIIENAASLECTTLDTTKGASRCSGNSSMKCSPMPEENVMEAQRALEAIEMYIKEKVRATSKLKVVEPCRRCHTIEMSKRFINSG
ncbi:hypothetical protein ACP4OV_025262 [Aristida adscensionis]